jgi:ABC-type phosphate/phosphonate transport system permease subunit
VSRSLREIIVAIFLVAMVGFGPFAGFLTLAFATIGFLSKLLAEDIEDIGPASVEAIRATGSGWFSLLAYGVLPQIMPRLIGLSLYRLDISFRESAIFVIVSSRSINAIIWALLSVSILGPGILAGITVFRRDIDIRESTVLGLVGAGGIGLNLERSLNTLAWPQVTLLLLVILGTVVVSEWISARIRHAFI